MSTEPRNSWFCRSTGAAVELNPVKIRNFASRRGAVRRGVSRLRRDARNPGTGCPLRGVSDGLRPGDGSPSHRCQTDCRSVRSHVTFSSPTRREVRSLRRRGRRCQFSTPTTPCGSAKHWDPTKDPRSESSRQINFWRRALADLPDQLDLPTDRPRPAIASNHGAKHHFQISERTTRKLNELARSRSVSLFMVLQAAYATLLSRLSGTSDIAIGAPIGGRGDQALNDVIGMFVNTLVLRTEVDPDEPFANLIQRVRDSGLSAYAHADVPFERLVEALNPPRSRARHPLFQVALTAEISGRRELEFSGVKAVAAELEVPIAKFDIELMVSEGQEGATDFEGLEADAYLRDRSLRCFDNGGVRRAFHPRPECRRRRSKHEGRRYRRVRERRVGKSARLVGGNAL